MWVDVDKLDAEVLGPKPARGALKAGIGTVGALRVAGPEDDHIGFLEAVLEASVSCGHADAHGTAKMVHGAPVPTFPTVRIGGNSSETDEICETHQRAEVIADIAPLMVGRHRKSNRTRPMHALLAVDFLGDNIERLVPADADIAGFSPVLRIALALWVEVNALQGIEYALVR